MTTPRPIRPGRLVLRILGWLSWRRRPGWPLVGHAGEGAVGVGAEGGDGGDADHDDQGQHDGVLDRRRAVFLLQELHQRSWSSCAW